MVVDSCDPSAPDGEQINREQASDALVRKHLRVMVRGSSLVAFGNGAQKALTFAVGIFVARGLGKAGFGIFSLAQSITRMGYFALEGGRLAAVKFTAHYHAKGDGARARGVLLGIDLLMAGSALLFAFVVALAAPRLAHDVYDKPDLTRALQIMVAEVPITALRMGYISSLQAVHDLVPLVAVKCFGVPGLQVLGAMWAWLRQASLPWFAAVFPASALVGLAAIQILHYLRFPHRKAGERPVIPWSQLLAFAAPLSLLGILGLDRPSIDVLVLGYGLSPADLGAYSVAANAATLVAFPAVAVAMVFMPTISTFYARQDASALQRTLSNASLLTTYSAMWVAGALICLRGLVMRVFGHEFTASHAVLAVMALSRLVNCVSQPSLSVLTMADKPWAALIDNSICIVVMSGALLLTAPSLGPLGAAGVMVLAMVLLAALRAWRIWRVYRLKIYDLRTLKLWGGFAVALSLALVVERISDGWTGTLLSLLSFGLVMALLAGRVVRALRSALAVSSAGPSEQITGDTELM